MATLILVDTNLLIYAKVSDLAPHHEPASRWLDAELSSGRRVGLPWPSLLGFVRIVTHPRIMERPLPADEAWEQVWEWLAVPGVFTPGPTDRHERVLRDLVAATRPTAALVHDADLAALALEHGLELCSTDGDFARFPSLRWRNPIA